MKNWTPDNLPIIIVTLIWAAICFISWVWGMGYLLNKRLDTRK